MMANHTTDLLRSGTAAPGEGTAWGRRLELPASPRAALLLPLLLAILPVPALVPTLSAQDYEAKRTTEHRATEAGRRIVVSLEERRLWLIDGTDTLMAVPVAVGRRESFHYAGRTYDWRTPRGERTVLAKRSDPLWAVPEWHYYERAANENLEIVRVERGGRYPLADGSRLEVRGDDVVRILGGQYWKVPRGREIIIDGVLYVPPPGTRQRLVPDVLGTRALDLGEGYLIHGTNRFNRASVGNAASHGCVRMRTPDVERLYDLVTEGTIVVIY